MAMLIQWEPEPEFWSANRAERARIGTYELVAFDLSPDQLGHRTIGWELFAGPKLQDLVAKGDADSFKAAQAAAEAAYLADLQHHRPTA